MLVMALIFTEFSQIFFCCTFTGDIAYAAFYKGEAFSDKRIKEFGFLADGWTLRLGNVTREDSANTWKFHQGFYNKDTLVVYMGGSGTYDVTFDGHSPGSGDITIWATGQSSASEALESSSGAESIQIVGGDSLYFTTTNMVDSIYIDNLYWTPASTRTGRLSSYSNYGAR